MKDFTTGILTVLSFALVSVLLYVFAFEGLGVFVGIVFSVFAPILVFSLVLLIADLYYKIQRAFKVQKDMYEKRRKEQNDFREWFEQNHKKTLYEYGYPYQDIARNNFKIEKLQTKNRELSREYSEKYKENEGLDVEVQGKLQHNKDES